MPDEPAPTAEPVPDDDPPPRFNVAAVRLGALGLALVLTVSITMVRLFVGGPPSVEELRAQAGVENWSGLPIGVKDDQPGIGFRDGAGIWSGFDIDIAYMIAEDLGFRRNEVRFYAMESEDRARMQATDAKGHRVPVKMVIASYSITAAREAMAGVTFSAPYLFTEQSVVTLRGHPRVSALEDLRGTKVCTLSTSTSEAAPQRVNATVLRRNRVGECFAELRNGKVDAVTTDAAILAGYKDRYRSEFEHWDLGLDTTEAWGVNVGENEALKKLVDLTLYRSLKDPADDRWEVAYQRNLQSEEPNNEGTPIAVAQQPDVPEPDVREQPWESVVEP
ncbi:MAG TPA: transporter substrate-binding domain-containing protein [Actinoplanes sp.]|nr:transporter substrate-binding domain-containing protein [Actinoplanes sp.]